MYVVVILDLCNNSLYLQMSFTLGNEQFCYYVQPVFILHVLICIPLTVGKLVVHFIHCNIFRGCLRIAVWWHLQAC